MFNRSRVKAQLSMCNEGRHGFFEDIGTQVSIKSNSMLHPIGYNGRWGSMAVIQLLRM